MLSLEENDLICRTGPGTPMGNLFRRFWMPVLLSRELPAADCPPVRLVVLNEKLVAYRDSSGRVGVLQENCPHRGASLFFGRNEEDGLRCVYHGWKFDVSGACVDMPSEPTESNFRQKVQATSYPTREAAGLIWAYMGPPDKEPEFPDFAFNVAPPEHVVAYKNFSVVNYLQSLEGGIDSSHIGFLHRTFASGVSDREQADRLGGAPRTSDAARPTAIPVDDGTDGPGWPSDAMSAYIKTYTLNPRLEIDEKAWGMRYGAIRITPAGALHVRITTQVLPNLTMVAGLPWNTKSNIFVVPSTDETCFRFQVQYDPMHPLPLTGRPTMVGNPSDHTPAGTRNATLENDFGIDREMQKTRNYTGILTINNQDFAVVESMGAILNRTKEHLGTSDTAIIRYRRMLLQVARDLELGIDPPCTKAEVPWSRIRQGERIIPPDGDWRTIESEDTDWVPVEPPSPGLSIRIPAG